MIWFTADTHFGCNKLVENTRPEFVSCEEHDSHLLSQINEHVGRNDTLVIVGDFCKEKPGRYRPKLKCRNHLFILGNHDKEPKIRAVFGGNVWTQRMVKVGEQRVLCAHHPQCFWDRCHWGTYHAYGHIHDNTMREAQMDRGMPGRRSMDVGVDHAKKVLGEYRPWSWDEMLHWWRFSKGHDIIKREDRWNERDYVRDET